MTVDTQPQRFLTLPQAAAELGVSVDWARAHLPQVRLGDGQKRAAVVRVPRRALEAFIQERAK